MTPAAYFIDMCNSIDSAGPMHRKMPKMPCHQKEVRNERMPRPDSSEKAFNSQSQRHRLPHRFPSSIQDLPPYASMALRLLAVERVRRLRRRSRNGWRIRTSIPYRGYRVIVGCLRPLARGWKDAVFELDHLWDSHREGVPRGDGAGPRSGYCVRVIVLLGVDVSDAHGG